MSKLPRLFAPKRRGDAGAPAGSPVSGRAGVGSWRLLAWAPLGSSSICAATGRYFIRYAPSTCSVKRTELVPVVSTRVLTRSASVGSKVGLRILT